MGLNAEYFVDENYLERNKRKHIVKLNETLVYLNERNKKKVYLLSKSKRKICTNLVSFNTKKFQEEISNSPRVILQRESKNKKYGVKIKSTQNAIKRKFYVRYLLNKFYFIALMTFIE